MDILFYILNAGIIGLLVWWLHRRSRSNGLHRLLIPTLAIKILAGIALGLIFKYHYQFGDTLSYFKEGCRFADLARTDFLGFLLELLDQHATPFESMFDRQPRALLFSQVTSLLSLVTNDNYWLISVYYSIFSFVGLWLLAERLQQAFKNRAAILLSLFLFPSVVFWSAGIAKESLAIGIMALLISSFLGYVYKKKRFLFKTLLFDLFIFFLLWKLKYYYAGMLLLVVVAALVTFGLMSAVSFVRKSSIIQTIILIMICGAMTLIVSQANYNLQVDRMDNVIVKNHNAFINKSESNEVIHYNNLEPNWNSILQNSPKALVSGLFRPLLPGDGSGWLSAMAKLEHVVLVVLTISAIISIRNNLDNRARILILATVVYCVGLATFLALSAPNFGTLVRYKIGFLPFLLLIITIPNPWIKKINKRLFRS